MDGISTAAIVGPVVMVVVMLVHMFVRGVSPAMVSFAKCHQHARVAAQRQRRYEQHKDESAKGGFHEEILPQLPQHSNEAPPGRGRAVLEAARDGRAAVRSDHGLHAGRRIHARSLKPHTMGESRPA
jgi:hypothetical protein